MPEMPDSVEIPRINVDVQLNFVPNADKVMKVAEAVSKVSELWYELSKAWEEVLTAMNAEDVEMVVPEVEHTEEHNDSHE